MTDRVLLGKISAGSYGLRISRPGFDVKTATDAHLAFDSDWLRTLQIHEMGEASCSASAKITFAGTYFRLAAFSSLGYVPATYVWATGGNDVSPHDTPYFLRRGAVVTHTGIWLGYSVITDWNDVGDVPPGTFAYVVTKTPLLG